MRIEVLSNSSVSLHLGEGGFRILVGAKHGLMDQYHVWLVTDANTALEAVIDEINFSGIRLACTYPVWLSMPASLRPLAHLFTSFNEPWPLPAGWTVYPVSSGGSSTSWLFACRDSSVLVCGSRSSSHKQCLYRPIFQASKTAPVDHVDVLVPLTEMVDDLVALDDLKVRLKEGSDEPVAVSLKDPIETLALIVQLTHFIAELPKDQQGPVIVANNLWESMKSIPALYEWLHEDVQTYLQQCTLFLANVNRDIQPLALVDLVDTGRVVFSEASVPEARVVISPGPQRLFSNSTVAELERFYSPKTTVVSGQFQVRKGIRHDRFILDR